MSIAIKLFKTGYCTGNQKHIHHGQAKKTLKFYALWALIEHPVLGKIIFDTGYSDRFDKITQKFPFKLYKWATPVFHDASENCINRLNDLGINETDISHLIISHFHADHIGGVRDFPNAQKWCSASGWSHFDKKNNWSGVLNAYLKPLIPADFKANFIEKLPKTELHGFKAWKWTEDLYFIDLPGHSVGQIGLFLKNTNLGDVLLVSDASWTLEAIRDKLYPSPIVKVFVDSYQEVKNTIDKLHDFHIHNPNAMIIPTHCSEIVNKYNFNNFSFDV